MGTLSKNPDVIALIFIVLLLGIAPNAGLLPDRHDPIQFRPFLTEVVGRLL